MHRSRSGVESDSSVWWEWSRQRRRLSCDGGDKVVALAFPHLHEYRDWFILRMVVMCICVGESNQTPVRWRWAAPCCAHVHSLSLSHTHTYSLQPTQVSLHCTPVSPAINFQPIKWILSSNVSHADSVAFSGSRGLYAAVLGPLWRGDFSTAPDRPLPARWTWLFH